MPVPLLGHLVSASCRRKACRTTHSGGPSNIDDADTAALTSSGKSPTQLSKATRAPDERSLLGPEHQGELEMTVLFMVEGLSDQSREDGRLDETHAVIYANDV